MATDRSTTDRSTANRSASDRIIAWSQQLSQVHDTLRTQLRRLQSELGSDRPLDNSLLTHCTTFCAALTTHHQGEETGMFVELVRARPDLESVVTNLVGDHGLITGIVIAIRDLADEARAAGPERRAAIRGELDGLAAIMESHFRYEERAIGVALDGATRGAGVRDTGWSRPVFELER